MRNNEITLFVTNFLKKHKCIDLIKEWNNPNNIESFELLVKQINIPTKNALNALTGIKAEKLICTQENIKKSLELYFGLPIKCISHINNRKKSDLKIEFENGTETTIQNKNGGETEGVYNRGWSVDRRKVETFNSEQLTILLKTLCLKQGTEKPIISNNISKNVINMCMLGANEEEHPKYFTHTKIDKSTGKITSISICSTDNLMRFMYKELYREMLTKKTCVHLSPNVYLQRKGGCKKDNAPNDIQMKFIFTDSLKKLFTPIF